MESPDLVGSFNGIGMVRIGVGDGTFLAVPTSPIGGEIASASGTPFGAIGDLNRDGRLDLIVERRVSYGQLDLDVIARQRGRIVLAARHDRCGRHVRMTISTAS